MLSHAEFKRNTEVIVTRACGVGSSMGEHKGIGRNRSFVDLSCDALPSFLSILHGNEEQILNYTKEKLILDLSY